MADEPELFGEGEGAPSELFAAVSEREEARAAANGRKGPGRPKGARNRKTEAFEAWFFARYRDPAQALGEIVTMSVMDLHALVNDGVPAKAKASLLEVLKFQMAVAGELMPYLHGKKPTVIEVPAELLPLLIIAKSRGEIDQARVIEGKGALSLGQPIEDEKARKSGVSEGEE